ncbi:hypothetical protein AUQ39_04840 [Lacticaseibacillus casei]|nr:hypothetical protein AUQ39_04840 [Lacticaseibacillus casei]
MICDGFYLVFPLGLMLGAMWMRLWILKILCGLVVWIFRSIIKWNIEDYQAYVRKWIREGRPKREPSEDDQPTIWYHF